MARREANLPDRNETFPRPQETLPRRDGMFHLVDESIPQYIGKGAQEVMQLKLDRLSSIKKCDEEKDALRRFKNYHTQEPIDVNGKTVSLNNFSNILIIIKINF